MKFMGHYVALILITEIYSLLPENMTCIISSVPVTFFNFKSSKVCLLQATE
jgi:hypothetical protein